MSANNVVWVMPYRGNFHVFYSGCVDNDPIEPDYEDVYYDIFFNRAEALVYAHDVVSKINKESYAEGYAGVEYGVCEVPYNYADNKLNERIYHIDKIIEEWEQKIKDLQFSIEQFEAWKKELTEKKDCWKECEHNPRNAKYHDMDELFNLDASGGDSTDDSKTYHPNQTADDSKPAEPSPCCKNCIKKGQTLDYCHLYFMKCPYDERNKPREKK